VEKFRVGDESAAMSRIGRSAERRTWKIQFMGWDGGVGGGPNPEKSPWGSDGRGVVV
jgi:hypothetical protein